MIEVEPTTLIDTRKQLHWASQLLSAAADATLEKADDDSHSNLGWDAVANKLAGRSGCDIDVVPFDLRFGDRSLSLAGRTLSDSLDWLSEKIGSPLTLRDYDMPDHAVAKGEPFAPHNEHLVAIAEWFSLAQKSLAGNGEIRIWPHHFDMGFWSPAEVEGRSVGGGFSLGDGNYDQPYFYINPYGIDKPESLPHLGVGNWTKHWFGAVITADELASSSNTADTASQFVQVAIEICRQMISESK